MTIDRQGPDEQSSDEPVVLNEDDWRAEQEFADQEPTLICTCCRPARPIYPQANIVREGEFPGPVSTVLDGETWLHEHDNSEASTLHAHIDRSSTDCDGPHEDHHVTRPNDSVRYGPGNDSVDEYRFKSKIVQWMPKHFADGGSLIIRSNGAAWYAPTDEGYELEEVRWCEEPACAYDKGWQRDIFAEQMGY